MFYGVPEGDLISQSTKIEGVFRPESQMIVDQLKKLVSPEIDRIEKIVGDKTKAERVFLLNCIRRVDQSKSYLKNESLAGIFSALALAVFVQSEHPDKIGHIFYERKSSSSGDNEYDIFNIDSWTGKKSANLPAPFLCQSFKRALVEKTKLVNHTPNYNHRRRYLSVSNDDKEVPVEAVSEVSERVNIPEVLRLVYGDKKWVTNLWGSFKDKITQYHKGELDLAHLTYFFDKSEQYGSQENENEDMLYTAEFVLDCDFLLNHFTPKHPNAFGDHCTIVFNPSVDEVVEVQLGKKKKLKIIGRVFDLKGDALLVEGSRSANKYPHITLSCANGTEPSYSNQMIPDAVTKGRVRYFSEPIEIDAIEGYATKSGEIITSIDEENIL